MAVLGIRLHRFTCYDQGYIETRSREGRESLQFVLKNSNFSGQRSRQSAFTFKIIILLYPSLDTTFLSSHTTLPDLTIHIRRHPTHRPRSNPLTTTATVSPILIANPTFKAPFGRMPPPHLLLLHSNLLQPHLLILPHHQLPFRIALQS